MILQKLTLQNIKSYVNETFDFSEGINCILGLNGSGKSTIIESIGVALFNYYRNLNQLLRYNESKGLITLEFIGNDDRRYRIVRTIRPKSSLVKIIDCETNEELFNNVSDVYGFVKSILRIAKTKEFSQMFEEIIAVPQGQYVSAFLEQPARRRENFDKLLGLNIYKDTSIQLKDLNDYLKQNRIDPLKIEISSKEGQLKNYDVKASQLSKLVLQIDDLDAQLIKAKKQHEKITTEKVELENLQKELAERQTNQLLDEGKIKSHQKTMGENEQRLVKAKEAFEIVEKNKVNYLKYEENKLQITQKEAVYEHMLQQEKSFKSKQNELEIVKNNIANTVNIIQEKVAEKTQKEAQIHDINKANLSQKQAFEQKQENYQKTVQIQQDLKEKSNNNIKKIEHHIERLKGFETRLQSLTIYEDDFVKMKDLEYQRLEQVYRSGEAMKTKVASLEKQITQLETELKTSVANSQVTRDGMCPFFKEKCKNINEKPLNDFFEEQSRTLTEQINQVKQEYNACVAELIDEKQLLIQMQKITLEKDYSKQAETQLLNLKNDIVNAFNDVYPINVDTFDLIELGNIKERFEENLNTYQEEASKLQLNEEEQRKEQEQLIQLRIKLNAQETSLIQLKKDIEGLNQQLKVLEQKKSQDERYVEKTQAEMKEVEQYLKQHADLNEQLINLKNENKALEKDHNQYVSYYEKSKDVQEIERIQKMYIEEITKLKDKILLNKTRIESLSTQYSHEKLIDLNHKYEKSVKEIGRIEEALKQTQQQHQLLLEEMNMLNALKQQLTDDQTNMTKYEYMSHFVSKTRDIFKLLPQKLSETYREYIAHEATLLYRRISNESIRIELDESYKVSLLDDIDSQKTKSMEQLSGGEQMSVAIAIRLSMLKHLSGLDIYFLDEPTINLDSQRRERMASVIQDVSSELRQLFVISHDDTFDSITDSIIHIVKQNNESQRL